MRFILFGVFLLFLKVEHGFADNQIQIDKLTSEYLTVVKALWKKLDTQLILLDRGSLLNEIYREHSRILNNDIDEHKVLWSLGIQKNQQLINTVLSVDTNTKNIKDYLVKSEYVKMVDLAKNAATQMQQSANELNTIIGQRSFWADLVSVSVDFQVRAIQINFKWHFVFDFFYLEGRIMSIGRCEKQQ